MSDLNDIPTNPFEKLGDFISLARVSDIDQAFAGVAMLFAGEEPAEPEVETSGADAPEATLSEATAAVEQPTVAAAEPEVVPADPFVRQKQMEHSARAAAEQEQLNYDGFRRAA